MKNNILITGITSEILQKLYLKIDKDDFNIFGVTRDKSKLQKQDNITVFEGDLTDKNFITKIFTENKYDIIIHGAAVTHSFDEKKYFEINLDATKVLADEIKESNAGCKFAFISSRTAGLKSGGYGLSKLRAEEYIQTNLEKCLILRPAEIFGSSKKEGIDKLIKDASTKKILFCPANLKSKLFPIHIDDAVNIMFDYIFNQQANNQILTINGNNGYTFIELAKKIAKKNNNKLFIIPIPKPVMFLIKYLLIIFRNKNLLAPDQVDRLYSEKEIIKNKNLKIDILKYSSDIFSNKQKFDNI